jgi:hypothetical protein
VREDGAERLLCAVNFASAPVPIDAPGTLVLSTDPDRGAGAVRELRGGEAVVVRL